MTYRFEVEGKEMAIWRYKNGWPLWETLTAGRVEVDVFSRCAREWGGDFYFVTESCVVKYSTSLDGPSNSQLGFFNDY